VARNIPAGLTAIIASEQNAPVELYTIVLDDATYYYANAEQDITFGGQVYTALALSRNRVSTSMDSKVDEISVRLDNVDKTFTQLIQTKNLQGKNLIVRKVFRDYVSDDTYYVTVFDGRIDSIAVDQSMVMLRVVSWLDAITKKYPGRMYQQQCGYKFGDSWCGIDKTSAANKATGTADSGTTTTLVDSALTQADNYWDGFVKVTAGTNSGLSRPILSFNQASNRVTFRIGFPSAIDNTSQYEIYRGCNKTQSDCVNKYNNWQKYGGFTTIPRRPLA